MLICRRVQAHGAGVGVDLGGRFAQAPAVGFAPGGAGAQPVAAGELRGDLAVAQAQGAHLLA